MKKYVFQIVAGINILFIFSLLIVTKNAYTDDKIQLEITSWRMDDANAMERILAVYNKSHSGVNVVFKPVVATEYDAFMATSLIDGTGADLIFLRSFSPGRTIYDSGFLLALNNDVPGLEKFPDSARKAWTTGNGTIYGVPVFGVTHGIYYYKDTFKKYGIKVPETWDAFMDICRLLKENKETVLAQGAMDEWTLYEVVFSGLGPNFYGGEKSRRLLMQGKMKLTDPAFINAFKRIDQLQPYLPEGYKKLDDVGMQNMFISGNAVMYIGGSWDLGIIRKKSKRQVGWFPPPVEKKGDRLSYCFHVDAGIGVNKNSKHTAQALDFLRWTVSTEFAGLIMTHIPGFYVYTPGKFELKDDLAKQMIDAAQGSDITIRTTWEKLSDRAPGGNRMMNDALIEMLTDRFTPEQAAAYVQKGLDSWYEPFIKE